MAQYQTVDGKPRIGGQELVERVKALVPALRARALAAEQGGRIPQATIDDLTDADVFKAIVPARFGGHEIDFRYMPHLFRELGRGCTSTAWTMGFLIYHNFQFAHFGEKAQREVWGGRGYTMAPGQVMPGGEARRVDGGFILKGRWGYATGIHHGDWMLLSALVREDKGGEADVRRFYVPVADFEVLDTWHVTAMRATGSHDVELHDVFVPEHRQIRVSDLRSGTSPGLPLNNGPLYRVPLLTFMSFGAVGPLVGAAEAIFEIVTDILRTKVRAYSQARADGQMSTRVRLSQLKFQLDAIRALYDARIDEIDRKVKVSQPFTISDRIEARAVVSHIARQCQNLVNELAREAGSRGNYSDSPVQRFQRDVNALATHALFDLDQLGNLHGGDILGQELPAGAMI